MGDNYNMKKRKTVRKPGRTIVLRSDVEFSPKDLVGLSSHNIVNNGKQFLVFDNIENSKNAFKILKTNPDVNVRFAYYRIFFKMSGLDESSDYTEVKKVHTEWIILNSGADVLYYKQYKKDSKLIGCGDFTVDTKESMDKLLNKDELKMYTIDKYSGTFYRYNKKDDNTDDMVDMN